MSAPQRVVTFDLFSALIDSRTGGSAALARLAAQREWAVGGVTVYDRWDTLTKQAHRECREWVPHLDLARRALAECYCELGLEGEPGDDVEALFATLPEWPLWPDVEKWLPRLAGHHPLGVLSNVDDLLFARTRAAAFFDPALLMSSERLRAYKPHARMYRRAQEQIGGLVHVASSARDVRGALEAGIPVVRLRRPGHRLDPAGPQPPFEVDNLGELASLLRSGAPPVPTT